MYRLESIQFYVRETGPARFASALGKAARGAAAAERVTSPLCHVRLVVKNEAGEASFGCAADRLSVRWLDKRPGRSKALKLRELVALIEWAGRQYLSQTQFDTPFALWRRCHPAIMQAGRQQGQEPLTASFASALLERAVLDGVSRLAGQSLFEMLIDERVGFEPAAIHAELKSFRLAEQLRRGPQTQLIIRHTVGAFDPLTAADWPPDKRLDDGLPETVEEYIRRDGIHYFKVKITGDEAADLRRLARLWEIMPYQRQPVITLDANEAFDDLERFAGFVKRLEKEQLGLFQHILYIEQPLPRRLALEPQAGRWIREIGRRKPVIIDESDGTLDALPRALELGYAGTSHKNCKGFFKSLLNLGLVLHHFDPQRPLLLSAEDLQNLPLVPLHQDFVSVGILGLAHCERNGHHYNFGLALLSDKDKQSAIRRHPDLYQRRGDEWFLHVRDGRVDCGSLQCPGFGVWDEPDWASMTDMRQWLEQRYPA